VSKFAIVALVTFASLSSALADPGDASRGQQDFRACAPCHSLEPDRNLTGPSLANLWGRKAGGLSSFDRYSDALKSSGIIWDDRALEGWLTDPQRMVPDNEMPFEGINDSRVREDLLAFLKDATKPGAAPERAQAQMKGMGGMMGGMMGGGGRDPNLKNLEPNKRVKAITYCRDTYRVTMPTKRRALFGNATCGSRRTPARMVPKKVHPRSRRPA
jgi:cytochrome c